ncbi:MAG TPA: DOMON domain-containing protein [bacterium]|nr:DOMON domain-containing protein [bacterium]
MKFSRFALPLAVLGALAVCRAQKLPVIPYDSTMQDRVLIDGQIDNDDGQEYPATFLDKASGLTVNWGFDDSLIYVGLQTKGRGWMAIGFGSPEMNESNMIIGYYTDSSNEVVNQIGAGHAHAQSPQSESAIRESEIEYDEETGITTMEFTYPLKFPSGQGLAISALVPGQTCDIILAQNTKTASLSAKHTNYSTLKVKLADKPLPAKPQQ